MPIWELAYNCNFFFFKCSTLCSISQIKSKLKDPHNEGGVMRHNAASPEAIKSLFHHPDKGKIAKIIWEMKHLKEMFHKDKDDQIWISDVGIAFFMLPIFPEIHLCQGGQVKLSICCWFTLQPGKIRQSCTVVPINNSGLQGKWLWKCGSTERVWKPLRHRICSTGCCEGLHISTEYIIVKIQFLLLHIETALWGK